MTPSPDTAFKAALPEPAAHPWLRGPEDPQYTLDQMRAMFDAGWNARGEADATKTLWIPVKLALPKPGHLVLLALDGNVVRIGFFTDATGSSCGVLTETEAEDAMKPTHWMPLPAPPLSGG